MHHRLRSRATAFAVGAAGLALASSAAAAPVGWSEAAKSGGKNVMTYTVDSLTFDAKGWRAHVSFRNVSKTTIAMNPAREFGVALFADNKTEVLSRRVGFAVATSFSSKLPTSLKPGDSWTGTIGGTGRLTTSARLYARVVFGPFTGLPGTTSSVVWITDHFLPLGAGAIPVAPSGPVI
jgi:hypothetical protein